MIFLLNLNRHKKVAQKYNISYRIVHMNKIHVYLTERKKKFTSSYFTTVNLLSMSLPRACAKAGIGDELCVYPHE